MFTFRNLFNPLAHQVGLVGTFTLSTLYLKRFKDLRYEEKAMLPFPLTFCISLFSTSVYHEIRAPTPKSILFCYSRTNAIVFSSLLASEKIINWVHPKQF